MSDYQMIVSNIRGYLASGTLGWTDELSDLAAGYSEVCREANDRLRRCVDYLRRGMRSEAIHLADCQPKLAQMSAVLDFPERKQWAEVCATHRLPVAPALPVEGLVELQAASKREQPLQPLLSRYRALAIAKASVTERLAIARLLEKNDPENQCWVNEVRTLEAVRAGELQAEVSAAASSKDAAAIERLWGELNNVEWHEQLPEDLRETAQSAKDAIQLQRTMAELRELAPRVSKAHRAEAPNGELSTLLTRWLELSKMAGVAVPDNLLRQVAPALDWQATKDRRQSLRDELKPFEHVLEAEEASTGRKSRWVWWIVAAILLLLGAAAYTYYHVPADRWLTHFISTRRSG